MIYVKFMSLIKGGGKAPVLISHQRQLSLSVTQVQGRNENEIFGNAQALCLWLQLSFWCDIHGVDTRRIILSHFLKLYCDIRAGFEYGSY